MHNIICPFQGEGLLELLVIKFCVAKLLDVWCAQSECRQVLMLSCCSCRRIANRESARRVRQKRQDVMEELQIKVGIAAC